MKYYTQVEIKSGTLLRPINRVDFCFKCRIRELYHEKSRKFRELDKIHHRLFQSYLSESSAVPESEIRTLLKNAGIDFKLRQSVYLVHKYEQDVFIHDMTSGFSSERYHSKSKFSTFKGKNKVYDHSPLVSHLIGESRLGYPMGFAHHAYKMIDDGDIQLVKYGADVMDCVSMQIGKWPCILRGRLFQFKIDYPFDTLCTVTATNLKLLSDVIDSYESTITLELDINTRNKDIAKNSTRVHPDHKRIGLNLMDILILLNPEQKINNALYELFLENKEDQEILVKSLKYWIDNVQDEEEFELIQARIKSLEENGLKITL